VFAAAVLAQVGLGVAALRARTDPEVRWLIGGALADGLSFAIHAGMEHAFQAPASMAVFLAVLVLPRRPTQPSAPEKRSPAKLVFGAFFAVAALVSAVVAARPGIGWVLARQAESVDLAQRPAKWDRALAWDPGNPEYARAGAVAYLWAGEKNPSNRFVCATRALAVANSGLAATPDHPDLLEAAGTALWWLGDRKEGEKFLARARELRPWLNRKPVRPIPRAKK